MKSKIVLVAGILMWLFSLSSFAEAPNSGEYRFRFGIIIPLSGDLAEYGSAIRNGFELAVKENPDRFSKVKFIYEDSRYDGKAAVDALQRLRTADSIDLFYLWGVSPTEAMLPIAAAQRLPVIAETTVKEATVGKPLVVRAARTGERIAKALAAELEHRHVKTVSFVVTEIPYYIDIMKHLEIALKGKGITVRRRDDVLPSQEDFKPFLLDRKSREEEVLGIFLLPSQLVTFYRQAEQMKLRLQTFNADLLDSKTTVNQCPDNINGTFFTQVGVTPAFRERYIESYGNDTQAGSAAQAYDVGMIVSELFGNLDRRLSSEEVIARISKMPPQKGATGSFQYSDTPDSGKEIRMPVSMKIIRGKAIEVLNEDTGF